MASPPAQPFPPTSAPTRAHRHRPKTRRTKDECLMTEKARMTNSETRNKLEDRNYKTISQALLSEFGFRICFVLQASEFGFDSSFVIRQSVSVPPHPDAVAPAFAGP